MPTLSTETPGCYQSEAWHALISTIYIYRWVACSLLSYYKPRLLRVRRTIRLPCVQLSECCYHFRHTVSHSEQRRPATQLLRLSALQFCSALPMYGLHLQPPRCLRRSLLEHHVATNLPPAHDQKVGSLTTPSCRHIIHKKVYLVQRQEVLWHMCTYLAHNY